MSLVFPNESVAWERYVTAKLRELRVDYDRLWRRVGDRGNEMGFPVPGMGLFPFVDASGSATSSDPPPCNSILLELDESASTLPRYTTFRICYGSETTPSGIINHMGGPPYPTSIVAFNGSYSVYPIFFGTYNTFVRTSEFYRISATLDSSGECSFLISIGEHNTLGETEVPPLSYRVFFDGYVLTIEVDDIVISPSSSCSSKSTKTIVYNVIERG